MELEGPGSKHKEEATTERPPTRAHGAGFSWIEGGALARAAACWESTWDDAARSTRSITFDTARQAGGGVQEGAAVPGRWRSRDRLRAPRRYSACSTTRPGPSRAFRCLSPAPPRWPSPLRLGEPDRASHPPLHRASSWATPCRAHLLLRRDVVLIKRQPGCKDQGNPKPDL